MNDMVAIFSMRYLGDDDALGNDIDSRREH